MDIFRLRVINNCSVTTAASFLRQTVHPQHPTTKDTFTFLDLFYLDGSESDPMKDIKK